MTLIYLPYACRSEGWIVTAFYRCRQGHVWTCQWDDPRKFPKDPLKAERGRKVVPITTSRLIPAIMPGIEVSICYLCLKPLHEPIDMDHVLPRSRGGEKGPLMPTHAYCNRSKGNRPLLKTKESKNARA